MTTFLLTFATICAFISTCALVPIIWAAWRGFRVVETYEDAQDVGYVARMRTGDNTPTIIDSQLVHAQVESCYMMYDSGSGSSHDPIIKTISPAQDFRARAMG